MKSLAIIGGGSWGTALAIILAARFPRVRLWVYEADLSERLKSSRVNDVYLPGLEIPPHATPTCDLAEALDGAAIRVSVAGRMRAKRVMGKASFAKLADSSGEILVVDFFATWCRPCHYELPVLEKMSERDGVAILGINRELTRIAAPSSASADFSP